MYVLKFKSHLFAMVLMSVMVFTMAPQNLVFAAEETQGSSPSDGTVVSSGIASFSGGSTMHVLSPRHNLTHAELRFEPYHSGFTHFYVVWLQLSDETNIAVRMRTSNEINRFFFGTGPLPTLGAQPGTASVNAGILAGGDVGHTLPLTPVSNQLNSASAVNRVLGGAIRNPNPQHNPNQWSVIAQIVGNTLTADISVNGLQLPALGFSYNVAEGTTIQRVMAWSRHENSHLHMPWTLYDLSDEDEPAFPHMGIPIASGTASFSGGRTIHTLTGNHNLTHADLHFTPYHTPRNNTSFYVVWLQLSDGTNIAVRMRTNHSAPHEIDRFFFGMGPLPTLGAQPGTASVGAGILTGGDVGHTLPLTPVSNQLNSLSAVSALNRSIGNVIRNPNPQDNPNHWVINAQIDGNTLIARLTVNDILISALSFNHNVEPGTTIQQARAWSQDFLSNPTTNLHMPWTLYEIRTDASPIPTPRPAVPPVSAPRPV